MSDYTELLLGCGNNRSKKIWMKGEKEKFEDLTTLDISQSCDPDVVWDLCNIPLPFEENQFNEIHAYDVLEHTGAQGDYKFFFNQFADFHRILKPDGILIGICPAWNSEDAWGDPSHTRVITPSTILFLSQKEYQDRLGKTPMSDFRYIYDANFDIIHSEMRDQKFLFGLKARK